MKLELTKEEVQTVMDALSTEKEISEDAYKHVENITNTKEEADQERKILDDYICNLVSVILKIEEGRKQVEVSVPLTDEDLDCLINLLADQEEVNGENADRTQLSLKLFESLTELRAK